MDSQHWSICVLNRSFWGDKVDHATSLRNLRMRVTASPKISYYIIRTLTLPFQWKLPYPLYACNKIDTLWHVPFNRTKAKDQGMLGIPAKSPICRWTIGNHWQPLAHFERGHLHTPLTWSWPDLNLAVGPGGSRCSWLWFGYDLLLKK